MATKPYSPVGYWPAETGFYWSVDYLYWPTLKPTILGEGSLIIYVSSSVVDYLVEVKCDDYIIKIT